MKHFCFAIFAVLLLAASLAAEAAPDGFDAPAQSQAAVQTARVSHRTRVALALSGGGSLGLAHIGVLKYFEEHHIPVDAIAGSSMGGLVGGFYATGHTPAEMEAAFDAVVWDKMLRVQTAYQDLPVQARKDRAEYPGDLVLRLGHGLALPAGLSTAEALDLFLSRQFLAYSTVEDFGELPTPFRCVATQLENGEKYVFKRGNLARALRATMSVPGIFTPVEWDGHILVDGGLVDNLPTDVAREMGADVVVAVHFSTPLPPTRQLQSLPNVLTQAVSVAISVTERENLRNADLVLAPSLVGIGGIDFAHVKELIERGYQAAEQKQRFLATLALGDDEWAAYQAERRSRMRPAPPQARRLVAHSGDGALRRRAQAEFDREVNRGVDREIDGKINGNIDSGVDHNTVGAGSPITLDAVEHELSTFVASAALPGAFYGLTPGQNDQLNAELEPRTGSQFFIRPSLELAVANGEPTRGTIHGFATWLPQDAYRATYRMQFAAGYNPLLAAEYVHPISASQWFWSPALDLRRQDSETYSGSLHLTHWQDTYSGAFDFGYGTGQRLRLRAGAAVGYEHLSAIRFPGVLAVGDGAYVAPRLIADWNSLDDPSLPGRGSLLSASMTARYRRADGRTVPLARGEFAQHVPLLAGTATVSVRAATSFGAALSYFDLFPLGGPSDLHAFHYQQFHSTSYALGGLAYRRPIGEIKLFGQRPQFGAWYDAAGVVQPLQGWQSGQSGSLGVLINSPLGVITFAVGRTSDGQTRGWFNVGRP
jgi:NTE family protein